MFVGGFFYTQHSILMKKLVLTSLACFTAMLSVTAQESFDRFLDLRHFYLHGNYGTARTQAMGGAFTALGGDISNTYINPAGLGFYNRSEFSGSFNFLGNNTTTTYINSQQSTKRSPLDLGQLGVVFSKPGTGTRVKRGSFGVSYNTLTNFSNYYQYAGSNTHSSISDSFTESANANGVLPGTIIDRYEGNNNAAQNGTELAVVSGLLWYENGNYLANEQSGPVNQDGQVNETGNLGQLNLSYGANFDDKTYVGGSIGIQFLNFYRETVYNESFPNGVHLRSLFYDNELSLRGTGINLTLGVIQRLNDHLNLGATITTPTIMRINDSFQQFAGVDAPNSNDLLYSDQGRTAIDQYSYRSTSPLKASVGLSAFLPKKIGVASIEAEYVGYSRMSIKDKTDNAWSNGQTNAIHNEFKDVVNIKAGIELRKGIGRLRGGLNFITDPIKNAGVYNVKKNSVIGSLGIGIRNSNYFADLSYSRQVVTSDYIPYWGDSFDFYSATIRQTKGIVGITIGSFF